MNRQLILILLVSVLTLPTGCSSRSGSSSSDNVDAAQIPKMEFHKPESIALSAKRLREIHAHLVSSEELVPPRKFTVREVIHGKGAGAHSHYYLVDKSAQGTGDAEPSDHGHEEMESKEVIHEIEVDVLTEYIDVARWLPSVAADSEMNKDSWKRVKEISKELSSLWPESESDASKIRELYRSKKDPFEALIQRLESEVENSTGEQLKDKVE